MDILIRNISEEDAKALDLKAKGAGAEDRMSWLRDQLHSMAVMPERYAFRVQGQVGTGGIRRYSDHVNGTSSTYGQFNEHEAYAINHAADFVRRNAPGDKERAFGILVTQFGEDNVFEVPV